MSRACPTEDDLIALLDGQATESRASDIRVHLQRCASCREAWGSLEDLRRALAAPLAGVSKGDAADRVLRRIAAEPPAPVAEPRPARRWGLGLAGALGVAAVAASVGLALSPGPGRDDGVFAARGASPTAGPLRRGVGVVVRHGSGHLEPLAGGEVVDAEATFAVSYRNLGPERSAFLMVFAVDAARAVHWIHPAFVDARTDPSSVPLDHAPSDRVLPTAAALDDPATGPLRVLTLVTPRPLHVSEIEALRAPELELGALRARFPDAELTEISVELRSPNRPRRGP